MNKTVASWAGIFMLSVLLSGHASASGLLSSSENRINAAFPVATEVQTGKTATLELATGAQKREFETKFDAHLKQRARSCVKDYSPSFFTSAEEIRNHLNNPTCFADADKEIIAWLGIRKVGLILAQQPLIPILADDLTSIIADNNILGAPHFASNASVALIEMTSAIELIDIKASKPLYREQQRSRPAGPLSPNGRLFITSGNSDQLKIRDTQTGEVITEIPSVLPWEFHWLDERTAFYVNRKFKSFFIDFTSGETIATGMMNLVISKTVRLPDTQGQYAVLTGNKVSKFELVRDKAVPELKLLTEKPIHLTGLATNTSGVTADSAYFFSASTHLTLVDLRSLESEKRSLEPFQIQTGIPSPDPDKIIITGFIQPHDGSTSQDYLYSISKRTLAQIKPDRQNSLQRLVHISSQGKLGMIENNRITLINEPQMTETIPLRDFVQNAVAVSEQHKVTIAERIIARENSCRPTNEKNKNGTKLHAIGIYEGPLGRSNDPANKVDIKVYKTDRPIVLALFNYEPVVWNIKLDKGAKVSEIIVNSSEGTKLSGVNKKSIKVTRQNFGKTAYEDCNYFQFVAPKLKEFSGLNTTSFQGTYRGTGFAVRTQQTPPNQVPDKTLPSHATNRKAPATKHDTVLGDGKAAYEKGDFLTALDKLIPLADKGDAMAQNTLGKMYMQGQGVPRDFDKALLLFNKAAQKKLPNAQNNLGVMYAGGYGVQQDFKQAIVWFKKAADQGYAVAINNLADLYEKGVGIGKDPIEAEKWRYKSQKLASARDSEIVNIKLAGSDSYEKAENLYLSFRFKEALPLYISAAEQGNPEAQLKLASMYKYAQGVEKNEQQAKYWENKAAAQGYSDHDGRDRIYFIDSSSEEGKKSIQPTPEPRANAVSAPSPTGQCACTPGTSSYLCCPDKMPIGKSMEIKPERKDRDVAQ